ncbi:DnaJ domain [Nesidiocoris tenuis]|nr:DnaJ domain [Nesidiocoris tenuis]
MLDISPDADSKAVKRAFRTLSLLLHPDKNPAADAEVKFRQLVAVHDILKDPNKRAKYDDVLVNGLPDWKQAIYYYRRVRKMGLVEMSVILFIIITIGQYCVAWAAYFEKKYTMEEFVRYKYRKIQKKQKKGKAVDEVTSTILPNLMSSLPKPSVSCTLPVQIFNLCWFLIFSAPPLTYCWIRDYFRERAQQTELPPEEESEEEVVTYVPRERGPRRRKGFNLPEVKENDDKAPIAKSEQKNEPKEEKVPLSGGLWTDDDLLDLIRLMNKFPPTTSDRWVRIGYAMKRHPMEVSHMAHKIKDQGFKPKPKVELEPIVTEPKKVKTRAKLDVEDSVWSPIQQKALEAALAAHPKGSTSDRWARIAAAVPGKSKEECIARYKLCHELVKKKKDEDTVIDANEAES